MEHFQKNWKFGTLNSVEINLTLSRWELYDYLPKMSQFPPLVAERKYQIIGATNDELFALLQFENDTAVYVVFEMDPMKLIPIAATLENLIEFYNDVELLWMDCPDDARILNATKENFDYARHIIEAFAQKNPHAQTDYLEYQCFAGLTLGFPLI